MINKIDHFGIVVRNINKSIKFYEEIIGMKLKRKLTVVGEGIGRVNELNGAAKVEIAILELKGNHIELLEFKSPKGVQLPEKVMSNHYGKTHIAFEVENIEEVYNLLKSEEIKFTSIPRQIISEKKELKCPICTFFKDPDGVSIEILQRNKME